MSSLLNNRLMALLSFCVVFSYYLSDRLDIFVAFHIINVFVIVFHWQSICTLLHVDFLVGIHILVHHLCMLAI